MKLLSTSLALSAGLSLGALAPLATTSAPASAPAAQEEAGGDMAAMMQRMQQYTQPGPEHAYLERLVGRWKTETTILMDGQRMGPTAGTAETEWLYDGRWLRTTTKGSIMGMPIQSTSLMGYDKFKQSYVATTVSTMDTAMNRAEGDLDDQQNDDPNDDVLILWGTIDEYLTGEHDKMVKTVFRFPSEDSYVMEIHDMPIGDDNTQVVEVKYTRAE